MESNESLSPCYPAQYLAESLYLNAILVIRIILCSLGIIFCIVLIKVQRKNLVFHKNALILFTSHHVSLILQSGTVITNGMYFVLYRVSNDPCDLLLPYPTCVLLRFVPAMASYATILSLCTLALERSWASYRYRSYENASVILGVSLSIIQWTIAFTLTAILVDFSNMESKMIYCNLGTSRTSGLTARTTMILVVAELLAIGCFFGLLFVNKRRKSQLITACLTEKYQLDENIRAIQLLIPTVLTHALIFIPPLCFYSVYLKLSTSVNTLDYPLIMESTSWAPMYSAVLPMVLFWRNRALRTSLRNVLNLNKVHHQAGSSEQSMSVQNTGQNAHFIELTNLWAEALEQNQAVRRV